MRELIIKNEVLIESKWFWHENFKRHQELLESWLKNESRNKNIQLTFTLNLSKMG